nr:synaptobrevin, longin-like domain protein [Tanacetum cinerariifolium]
MAFISSAKNSSGNGEVNTASIPTTSTQVSPASANVAAASINLDTAYACIASQSSSSQIKYEDINQIDEDDIEEMDIKVPRSQDRGRRENFKQGSKVEESAPKALMAIDRVRWDWSYMANEEEDHALVADQEAPTEFALMAKSSFDTEPEIKFVKAADSPTVIKTSKDETVRKPSIKYAEILAFCDYHNMIAILEKYEHNVDFHPIVDFVEASYIRYALTINPTVYVSHIQQFWSTVRIKTMDEGTKILTTIDGFNEFSSNITTALVCLATNRVYNFSKMIFDGMVRNVNNKVSKFLMYPRQYTRRARISQSSALSTIADEPASPLGDDSKEMASKIATQDLEIASLKAKIKMLEEKDRGGDEPSEEDATIKGRSLETGEEAGIERSTNKGSNDTEEMVNVLTSLDAASILTSGVQVSIPPAAEVATVSIPLLVKFSLQLEEDMARDAQRMNEQIAKDAEIARIHAEKELQILIDGLDRNNETVVKYLQEYEQLAADLDIEERIELINDLVKYQDNYAKVLKRSTRLLIVQDKEMIEDILSRSAFDSGNLIIDRASSLRRIVGNKMLKAFLLPVMSSYCQKTFPLLVKKGSPC